LALPEGRDCLVVPRDLDGQIGRVHTFGQCGLVLNGVFARKGGHTNASSSVVRRKSWRRSPVLHFNFEFTGAISIFYLAWNDVQANMPVLPQKNDFLTIVSIVILCCYGQYS
jgi:hypothetical protein